MADQRTHAERFADSFNEHEHQAPVPADSPLGRAMAEYRERVARGDVEAVDPDTFTVEPRPVALD